MSSKEKKDRDIVKGEVKRKAMEEKSGVREGKGNARRGKKRL